MRPQFEANVALNSKDKNGKTLQLLNPNLGVRREASDRSPEFTNSSDNTKFNKSRCRENVVSACLPKDLFKKQKACQGFERKEDYSFKMFQRVDNVFAVISVHFFTLYMMDNNLTLEDMGDFEQSELVETIKWVAYSIVAYVIVGIGLLGNLASLVVLTRPNLKVGIITSYIFASNFDIIN